MGAIFSFSGRSGRLAYLGMGFVQVLIIGIGFGALMSAAPKGVPAAGAAGMGAFLFFMAMMLLSVWVGLAATARRLRDMGWPVILGIIGVMFVPFVGFLLLFWPGNGESGPDTSVFSDDPPAGKKDKAPKDTSPGWMDRAMAEIKQARPSAPAPQAAHRTAQTIQPRFSGAQAASMGPRSEFGLRR